MSKVGDTINRLLGRSVVDLAQEVDAALAALAQAQGERAAAQHALDLLDQDVRAAMKRVESARDALFTEHPELRGDITVTIVNPEDNWSPPGPALGQTIPEGLNPAAFDPTPIEVDDDNDPRFTGGAGSTPSANDDDPLPEVVWEEHDE